jgi:hypothetical protein
LKEVGDIVNRFCRRQMYNLVVPRKKKAKRDERPVFDSIRKPTAPPSRKFGDDALEEKRHPSLRKVKHKKNPAIEEQ